MIVSEDKVEWFFVIDHHDLHIGGYAKVDRRLSRVRRVYSENLDDWSDDFEVFPLNWKGRISARIRRRLFEMFVNRRWSYRNGAKGLTAIIRDGGSASTMVR
jgi:hypothetical protein